MKEIGNIGNYYGGLHVKEENGKYYWIIENYCTDFSDITEWEEISKNLYLELLRHSDNGVKEPEFPEDRITKF